MKRYKLTHPALEGGIVHFRAFHGQNFPWPTVCIWPNGKRQNALSAIESVGLDFNWIISGGPPYHPKLVDAAYMP